MSARPPEHAWRDLIESKALDSGAGDPFSLTISMAISAKRQADALERLATAAETMAGEMAHPEWGIAPTLRNMDRR